MITLALPKECIHDCTRPGTDASDDVRQWLQAPKISKQFDAIPADDIRRALKEYGAWDAEELEDDEDNRARLLWIAAGNCKEEGDTTACFDC